MLIKIIGCLFVICATSGYGYSKGLEYKKHVEELERLKRVIWHLKGELSYTRTSLQEICRRVSKRVEKPYENWLISMSEIMEQKGYSALGRLWEVETLEHLQEISLATEDVEELASLGYQMGYLDVTRQEETLKWYGERLEEKRKRLSEKMEEKRRMCNLLGVLGGIFLAILFF